jgi:hypothetical protein
VVCDAGAMSNGYPLDPRKWFDRFQPQTLQIATWLLYINGFFALVDLLGDRGWLGVARIQKGAPGLLVGLAVIVAYVAGGWLMANERRLGHRLALAAALSPFLLRIWIYWGLEQFGIADVLVGGNVISLLFDVALIALLVHPQSREHVRVYFR